MEFTVEFCTKHKPRALYLLAYRKPKTAEIWALAGEHPDSFLRYSFINNAILSLSGLPPDGLTERSDGLP
jgi:hypothetical protein